MVDHKVKTGTVMSHSPRSGWIEMAYERGVKLPTTSHSPRSGWIEIDLGSIADAADLVPLPTEWVD